MILDAHPTATAIMVDCFPLCWQGFDGSTQSSRAGLIEINVEDFSEKWSTGRGVNIFQNFPPAAGNGGRNGVYFDNRGSKHKYYLSMHSKERDTLVFKEKMDEK